MSISPQIERVCQGERLSRSEACTLMDMLMTGQAGVAQIAGLLVALRGRGESANEVAGFVDSMRAHLLPVEHGIQNLVDGCGTGGDGKSGFNVSTAASIVAASAGARVAKHGNRSISSRSGSADLLEACGARLEQTPAQVAATLKSVGFAFMFAPLFHPAMRHVMPTRKELGMRTVFNILGPLTNPARVRRQVIGVFSHATQVLMADVLSRVGCDHVLVVHSDDGFDELSLAAPTHVIELKEGERSEYAITPEEAGCRRVASHELTGGTPAENQLIFQRILAGKESAHSEMVALNAGALLYVAGSSETIAEGVRTSREELRSGRAAQLLEHWVQVTRNGS